MEKLFPGTVDTNRFNGLHAKTCDSKSKHFLSFRENPRPFHGRRVPQCRAKIRHYFALREPGEQKNNDYLHFSLKIKTFSK